MVALQQIVDLEPNEKREASELIVSYLANVSDLYNIPACDLVDAVHSRVLERFGNG